MANKRWACPEGCGANVLAPGRMRKDDTRRYCLPCSERTGKLVQRTCPALDNKRNKAKEQRQDKQMAARVAERETTYHMRIARAALKKAAGLKTWKREGLTMNPRWLRLLDAGSDSCRTSGRAGLTGHVKVGGCSKDAWIQQVVVHEMAHICLYRTGHADAAHDRRFQGLLMSASAEFFGLDEAKIVPLWKASQERHKGSGYKVAYQLDQVIIGLVPDSDRDARRKDNEANVHHKELEAKKQATATAKQQGWGRGYSARVSSGRLVIHAHRYTEEGSSEEFACGYAFDEYGPHSGWAFTESQFQITCTKCIRALNREGAK